MSKLKLFLAVAKKSLTSFPYYKEITKAKFSFSVKYLFFLFYLLSLVGSLIFASTVVLFVLPAAPAFIDNVKSKADTFYPKALVVDVKDGIVSTNVREPYVIADLLTIDTTAKVEDIKDTQTPALVTKNAVVIKDKNTSFRVYTIDPGTNLTIDKAGYDQVVAKVTPLLQYAVPAIIVLLILSVLLWPLLAGALSLVWQLLYLLLFSALFFLLVKLMKKDLKFKKLYQLAIHASTLPILLAFVTSSLTIQMPVLLGTAILFVFMILVVNQF